MKTTLFIGRFQPLHKGHVFAIKKLLRKKRNVLIAIGSINKKGKKNPFSFAQRKKMVVSVFLRHIKNNRIKITGIKDYRSDERWIREVRKHRFDEVVTGNSWVVRCLKNHVTRKPVFLKKTLYKSSNVRKRIRNGMEWKNLVPREVYRMIKDA